MTEKTKNKNIMKKLTLLITVLLTAKLLFAQYNKIDTSFYSEALGEVKMVDVYFPPGYDENPDWSYPVICYLHGWNGDQNTMGSEMMSLTQSLINDGIIDPIIMVGADSSPDPFGGSMYVNSSLWGNYEDYMINDLINWIDASFRTIPEKGGRALLGQSMGAYGAFRYGIFHRDKFKALAAHAGILGFNKEIWMDIIRQQIINENQPGPPYYYDYGSGGLFTKGTFLLSGAFSPNAVTTQTYINPPVVEYLWDENADYIDSIYTKWQPFDLSEQIKQLTIADSIGIYFGCGTNDGFLLYPLHEAMQDTLDAIDLPYEFYSHNGNHGMPAGFKQGSLIFIDSLLMPPAIYTGISTIVKDNHSSLNVFPNPFEKSVTIRFNGADGGETKIGIWNCLGQEVIRLYSGNLAQCFYQSTFDTNKLPEGIYFCRVQIGNETITKKIIKL